MKILLIAMPDKASCFDRVMDIPNLGLCSLAGNIEDLTTDIRILDLGLHQKQITKIIENELSANPPDIVGLSAMSFQYDSARRIAGICKNRKNPPVIILGGYHATLLHQEIGTGPDRELFDFLVRGEGEIVFHNLLQALRSPAKDFESIPGLSFRKQEVFYHNPQGTLADLRMIKLPARGYRISTRFLYMGEKFDCIETSRGCLLPCNFCSIQKMYGREFRTFPISRVIRDLQNLKAGKVKGVFIVDDNITLNVERLKELCRAIIQAGLNDLHYIIQASVAGIASDARLAPLLREAGFQVVFLGIESGIEKNLSAMHKSGVNKLTPLAVSLLKREEILVIGGLIVGHPEDTKKDIADTFRYALELGLDHAIVQCLTPYPGTLLRQTLLREDLVANPEDFSRYNGFIANVRTKHLSPGQIARAVWISGIRLYFHPRYLASSRMWKVYKHMWFGLMKKSLGLVFTGYGNHLFHSRHKF